MRGSDKNMAQLFFDKLDSPVPGCNPEVANLSHGVMTGRMAERTEPVLAGVGLG